MKNRKLFAIITLVAFMLTMMPLMAFATSASNSSISVDKSSAKVNNNLEFILDLDAAVGAEQQVVVFAERSGSLSDADTISVKDNKGTVTKGTNYGFIAFKNGTAKDEYTLLVNSATAGTVTLKAYVVSTTEEITDANVAKFYNGDNTIIKTALVGNGCTGKFTAQSSAVTTDITVTKDGNTATGTAYTKNGVKDTDKVEAASGVNANNGADYYKVSMKFNEGTTKMVGEKVTISVDKDGATVNKEEATTSATGKIDFKVSATKGGTYTVTVECGSYSVDLPFTFGTAQVNTVKIPFTTQGTIAVDNQETVAMTLVGYDSNGNAMAASEATANLIKENFLVEVTSAPADSSLEGTYTEFVPTYNTKTSDNIYLSFKPDAAGEYTIKIYNKTTGAGATTTIKAAEFGTIDHATISYSADTFALGSKTQAPTVYVYDKNGVKKTASNPKYSYTGLGVAKFDNGQVTFKTDSEYAGKQIVVSVVANNKYAASTTLTIGADAASLKFTDATAEVGGEATVKAQVIDVNGNNTAVAASGSYDVSLESAIITERPEGATVSVDADYFVDSASTFLKKGTGNVTITSNKEGTVKANVVLKLTANDEVIRDGITYKPTVVSYVAIGNEAYTGTKYKKDGDKFVEDVNGTYKQVVTNNNPYTFYLSGVATATFGAKAPEKGTGDTVTFIIGNTTFVANGATKAADVAPYVANGRTFIPVRAFAEATGAKVEYDAATQVITITGEGLSAQMTIGSNILTVNGQTTVMDTAAAVTAEGRTVLPVRFAGQALGYGFEVAYGANGAVSSVTMFK